VHKVLVVAVLGGKVYCDYGFGGVGSPPDWDAGAAASHCRVLTGAGPASFLLKCSLYALRASACVY
jgi:hypothetical protein